MTNSAILGGTKEDTTFLVSSDVRRHNLTLILQYLVTHGRSARSDIASGVGLSRGAVTALVGLLSANGVVRESHSVHSPGKGRPRVLLGLAADSIALVAAQIDADRAMALVSDLAGNTLARFEHKHGRPMGEPDPVLDVLAEVLSRALDAVKALQRNVVDLTIVAFAPVGEEPAVVLADTDLGWGRVDVLAGLRSRLPGLPDCVRLVGDTAVSAAAELCLLPDVTDFVYFKSNSGIGGAIVTAGEIIVGGHGLAGALGHLAVDYDGIMCDCGQRGCLVTVAGPDAVLEAAGLGGLLRAEGLTVALARLVDLIEEGNKQAGETWGEAAAWVARALNILTLAVDPQVVVLGGYWRHLAGTVEAAFRQNRPFMAGSPDSEWVSILPGQLGDDAAMLGALWTARDRLLADPAQLMT